MPICALGTVARKIRPPSACARAAWWIGRQVIGKPCTARSMTAEHISKTGKTKRFVEYDPVLYFVAIFLRAECGVAGKPFQHKMAGPAAFFFQRHGQVPVIESDIGDQTELEAFVDDAVIKGDAFPVDPPCSFRQDAGPGKREPEDREPEGFGEQDIVLIAVIKIAGDGWPAAAFDLALAPGEGIPDGRTFAIAIPGAFVLYGCHGHSP